MFTVVLGGQSENICNCNITNLNTENFIHKKKKLFIHSDTLMHALVMFPVSLLSFAMPYHIRESLVV